MATRKNVVVLRFSTHTVIGVSTWVLTCTQLLKSWFIDYGLNPNSIKHGLNHRTCEFIRNRRVRNWDFRAGFLQDSSLFQNLFFTRTLDTEINVSVCTRRDLYARLKLELKKVLENSVFVFQLIFQLWTKKVEYLFTLRKTVQNSKNLNFIIQLFIRHFSVIHNRGHVTFLFIWRTRLFLIICWKGRFWEIRVKSKGINRVRRFMVISNFLGFSDLKIWVIWDSHVSLSVDIFFLS